MDRCRCPDYKAAVKNLRFFTVGTMMPLLLDKTSRDGYRVIWVKHGVDYTDMKFKTARASPLCPEHLLPDNILPKEAKKLEQMWCPFMSHYKQPLPEEEDPRDKKDKIGKKEIELISVMDKCRCLEYSAAVKSLKLYTVGTMLPSRLDKCNREGYKVLWFKQGANPYDKKFVVPKASSIIPEHLLPENIMSKEVRKIEQMWCPYMHDVKLSSPVDDSPVQHQIRTEGRDKEEQCKDTRETDDD